MWTEGVRSWWAGGFAGAPVPKGLPQLPRPAIIRLSGATISVNVPDSGVQARPTGWRYRRGESTPPIPSPLMLPPPRNIAPLHHDPRTKCVFSYIDPLIPRYLDYSGCARRNFQAVSSTSERAPDVGVEIRRRRTRDFNAITSGSASFAANILSLNAIVKCNVRRIVSDARSTTVRPVNPELNGR